MKNWLSKNKPRGEMREEEKLNVPNSPSKYSQLPYRTDKTYIVPDVVGVAKQAANPAPEPKPYDKINYIKEKSEADKLKDKFKKKELKKGGEIHIKPENKGKLNATKKATGKSTEELTHYKNSLTRKRAQFAMNSKKWDHSKK